MKIFFVRKKKFTKTLGRPQTDTMVILGNIPLDKRDWDKTKFHKNFIHNHSRNGQLWPFCKTVSL